MTIVQKKASNRAEFQFGTENLRYSIKDPSGTHSYSIEYESIPTVHSEMEERRVWFRNAGWLWVIIGIAQIVFRFTEDRQLGFPFWLLLGAGCLGYYYYSSTKFLVFSTDAGRIFVIDDRDRERIIAEFTRRRIDQLKRRYARIIDPANPERESARFGWLEKQGVISTDEHENLLVELRLGIVDRANDSHD